MVGPHDIKVHLPIISGTKKTVVESSFQIGIVHEPVPVINESVHSIFQSRVYPLFHHLWIIIVLVAPKWLFGLIVAREARITLFDDFPFPIALWPQVFMSE